MEYGIKINVDEVVGATNVVKFFLKSINIGLFFCKTKLVLIMI